MSASKRPIAALIAVLGMLVAAVAFSGPASAYPPGTAASLSLSASVACTSVGVNGTGFAPGSVGLSLDGQSVGSATAGSNGNFSTTVTLAAAGTDGADTIAATEGTVTAIANITISCGGGGGGTGGGGLATTGVAVIGIGALGALLLAGGGVMLMAGKRRKGSA